MAFCTSDIHICYIHRFIFFLSSVDHFTHTKKINFLECVIVNPDLLLPFIQQNKSVGIEDNERILTASRKRQTLYSVRSIFLHLKHAFVKYPHLTRSSLLGPFAYHKYQIGICCTIE